MKSMIYEKIFYTNYSYYNYYYNLNHFKLIVRIYMCYFSLENIDIWEKKHYYVTVDEKISPLVTD